MGVNGEKPFWLFPAAEPFVAAETALYLVVYKPPGMHSAPLREGEGDTLLDWAASRFPEIMRVRGRKAGEGGLLHRLDRETQGLIVLAKTQNAWDYLNAQQEAGEFVKEYDALSAGPSAILPGFPPPPFSIKASPAASPAEGVFIESAFRPWGQGRKAVRPVPAAASGVHGGTLYRTEILSRHAVTEKPPLLRFRLRIVWGFRHQIRCHLAWIGAPIQNDPLYGGTSLPGGGEGGMALRARALFFTDPESGERREYRVP